MMAPYDGSIAAHIRIPSLDGLFMALHPAGLSAGWYALTDAAIGKTPMARRVTWSVLDAPADAPRTLAMSASLFRERADALRAARDRVRSTSLYLPPVDLTRSPLSCTSAWILPGWGHRRAQGLICLTETAVLEIRLELGEETPDARERRVFRVANALLRRLHSRSERSPGAVPLSSGEMKLDGPTVRALARADAVYTSRTPHSGTLELTDPQGRPRVIACSRLHNAQQVPFAALRVCIDPTAETRLYNGRWGFRMNGLRVEWRAGDRMLSVGNRSVHTSRRSIQCATAPRQIGGEWLLPVELIPLLTGSASRK